MIVDFPVDIFAYLFKRELHRNEFALEQKNISAKLHWKTIVIAAAHGRPHLL